MRQAGTASVDHKRSQRGSEVGRQPRTQVSAVGKSDEHLHARSASVASLASLWRVRQVCGKFGKLWQVRQVCGKFGPFDRKTVGLAKEASSQSQTSIRAVSLSETEYLSIALVSYDELCLAMLGYAWL